MTRGSTVTVSCIHQLFMNQITRSLGGPRVAINLKQAKNKTKWSSKHQQRQKWQDNSQRYCSLKYGNQLEFFVYKCCLFSPITFVTKRYLWFSSCCSDSSPRPRVLSNLLSLFLDSSKRPLGLSPSHPVCVFLLVWSQWTSFPILSLKQATNQPILQMLSFIYRKKKNKS